MAGPLLSPSLFSPESVLSPSNMELMRPFSYVPLNPTQLLMEEEAEERNNFLTTAGYAVSGTALSAVDTILESFSILDERDMENYVRKEFPNFSQFFDENRGALQIASDVSTIWVPGMLGAKAIRTSGAIGKLATKTFGDQASPFLSSGKNAQSMFEDSFQLAREKASRVQTFTLRYDPELQTLNRGLLRKKVKDTVLENLAGDLAIVATMNESEFLFPEEMSLIDNLLMFGAANAVIGGVSYLHGAFVLNRGLNLIAGKTAKERRVNAEGVVSKGIVSNRGGSIFSLSRGIEKVREGISSEIDAQSRSQIVQTINALENNISDIFKLAGRDIPEKEFTNKVGLTEGQLRTLHGISREQPETFLQLYSIEGFKPKIIEEIEKGIDDAVLRKEGEILNLERKGDIISEEKIAELEEEIRKFRELIPVTFEADGWVNPGKRMDIFQDIAGGVKEGAGGLIAEGVRGMDIGFHPVDQSLFFNVGRVSRDVANKTRIKNIDRGLIGFDPQVFRIDHVRKMQELSLEKTNRKQANYVVDQLRKVQDSGGIFDSYADPVTQPILRRQREALPNHAFVVFGEDAAGKAGRFKLKPTGKKFIHPHIISRDAVYGIENANTLIAAPGVRESFGSNSFMALSHFDKTKVYAVLNEAARRTGFLGGKTYKLNHHTKIDALLAKWENEGTVSEFKDRFEFASLDQKFQEYQMLRNEAADYFIKTGEDHIYSNLSNVTRALNLPNEVLEFNPVVNFFETHRVSKKIVSLKDIITGKDGKTNLEIFLEMVRKNSAVDGDVPIKFKGNMLRWDTNKSPVAGIIRPQVPEANRIRPDQLVLNAQARAETLERLNQAQSPAIQDFLTRITAQPETIKSVKLGILRLIDGFPMSGAIGRAILQQSHVIREMPGGEAANTLADQTRKEAEKGIEALLSTPLGKPEEGEPVHTIRSAIDALQDRKNAGSMGQYNLYTNARGAGWDLYEGIVKEIDEKTQRLRFSWRIKPNAHNNKLWQRMFGEDLLSKIPPGTEEKNIDIRMPVTGQKDTPLYVNEITARAAQAMDMMSNSYLIATNDLLRVRGRAEVVRKPWHVPPRAFVDRERYHLLDEAMQSRFVVGGASKEEAKKLADQEIRIAAGHGIKLTAVSEEALKTHNETFGREFFEMIDFGSPALQTGKAQGKSYGFRIETGPELLRGQIDTLLGRHQNLYREFLKVYFEPELNYLDIAREAAGIGIKEDSIYRTYRNTLLGLSQESMGHPIQNIYQTISGAYDKAITAYWDWRFPDGQGKKHVKEATKEFESIARDLGKHSPFSNALDYAANTVQVRIPGTLRKHAAFMNEFTTLLTIRLLDAGMGFINMASLPALIPPTVKNMHRRKGESQEEMLERIGAFGGTTPAGTGYISGAKVLAQGVQFLFSEEGKHVMKAASNRGLLDQQAAELLDIFGRVGEGFVLGAVRDVSNTLSFVTDKTERLSRAFAFAVNYPIGKRLYGLEDGAAMTFAHIQAQRTIGDFRPSNRPVIFQGATGMPLGLFTTFMWNYFQRILNIAESGNKRALATQFGVQGALFGAESLPGFQWYMQTLTDNYDGSETAIDRMNKALGTQFVDVFLNGTMSTLAPRALGLGGGISIGPRAAVGFPFESGLAPANAVPGFRLAERAFRTSLRVFDNIAQENRWNPMYTAQVLAASNINKGIGNLLELFTGRSTNLTGDVIEKDTRNRIGIAARALGFKPLFNQEMKEEIWRANTTARIQQELKTRLSDSLHDAIRRGKLNKNLVENSLIDYMKAGGNPENFRRFFMSQMVKSHVSRGSRELIEALQGSFEENRVVRLLHLMEEGY